ncbi:unnamed protein product [Mucor hiemalis]
MPRKVKKDPAEVAVEKEIRKERAKLEALEKKLSESGIMTFDDETGEEVPLTLSKRLWSEQAAHETQLRMRLHVPGIVVVPFIPETKKRAKVQRATEE